MQVGQKITRVDGSLATILMISCDTPGGFSCTASDGRPVTSEDIEHSKVLDAIEMLHGLTHEQRTDIFNQFCKHCGSKDPDCQCWNDE